jgi:VWFA-related protein
MTRVHSSIAISTVYCAIALSASQFTSAQQQAESQKRQEPAVRIATEEVLLDVVARDKKGRPVLDLRTEEIEVYENGVRQQISSFRRIDRNRTSPTAETPQGAKPGKEARPVDLLRQINLVTMVFERLNNESRVLAHNAAVEFLKKELRPNTMVAVFSLDQRLSVLQQFTDDYERLKQAVDRATGAAASQFPAQSEAIKRELENLLRSTPASSSASNQQPGAIGAAAIAAAMAEMTLNTLRMTDEAQRQQQGEASIYSLMGMVKQQRRLAGRKTILYFSEGLKVTPTLTDALRNLISAANRANVSFYAFDARGLQTTRNTEEARDGLNAAVAATQQQQRSRGAGPVTREQIKALDTAEDSILKNSQANLATLAESTGGFLIADTNDLQSPVRRIGAELADYYELAYTPVSREYDGKFREIQIKVLRPDVALQSRSGYFALPPEEPGAALAGYELPMLAALSAPKPPHDFEFRSAALRFESGPSGVHYVLILETPIANLTVTPDPLQKVYRAHFAMMAMIKNAEGAVVQRFGQDYPFQGPVDRLEALRRGNVVFVRSFSLAPGRYSLETVAHDREPNRLSVKRAVLIVPAPNPRLSMSSVTVIKRIDPVDAGVKDPDNPFRFAEGKIIPNLGDAIRREPGANLSFYFVVYPAEGFTERPSLTLEFLLDGEVIAKASPALTATDENGRIPYIATAPASTFKDGRYEVRAIVQQGDQRAEEHAFFTLSDEPAAKQK